jgi:hypothetical protein
MQVNPVIVKIVTVHAERLRMVVDYCIWTVKNGTMAMEGERSARGPEAKMRKRNLPKGVN